MTVYGLCKCRSIDDVIRLRFSDAATNLFANSLTLSFQSATYQHLHSSFILLIIRWYLVVVFVEWIAHSKVKV